MTYLPPPYEAISKASKDFEKAPSEQWRSDYDAVAGSIHNIASLANPPLTPPEAIRSRQLLCRLVSALTLLLAAVFYLFLLFNPAAISLLDHKSSPITFAYAQGYMASSIWEGPVEPLKSSPAGWLPGLWWRWRSRARGGLRRRPGWWRHGKKHLTPEEAAEIFLTIPSNETCHASSASLTAFSHLVGTEGDRISSIMVKNTWEEYLGLTKSGAYDNTFDAGTKESREMLLGIKKSRGGCGWRQRNSKWHSRPRVWTDRYYSLLTFPTGKSSLRLSDGSWTATLFEDAVPEDPTAVNGSIENPPFHGFSFPGSASGEIVYVNQGRKEDYEALAAAGISLEGKIVLVRYGSVFRGLKVSVAEAYGAKGVIIYTDPDEDGEITAANGHEVYPQGPARQPSSIQRGSVQLLSVYAGDPLTPGWPAYKDAKRLSRNEDGLNLPGIPSLPLSGQDAKELLERLEGQGKQIAGWEGAIPGVGYWTGPGPVVELVNDVKENITAMWNTYAVIPGHISDEVVVVGNHRDAWVFGAADPNSGSASVNEIVRAFGKLLASGWKPLRTILIASWDGEELGLLGSTEFAEDYEAWIKEKVVTYLNVDVSVAGSLYSLGASPSLAPLLTDVSSLIVDPDNPSKTLLDALAAKSNSTAAKVLALPNLAVDPLGSGSDYTPFLQHLGIASGNIAYGRKSSEACYMYHSIFDSQYWMDTYGDPGFHRHVAVAKALGLFTLRLADSVILPISSSAYAKELTSYLNNVKSIAKNMSISDSDLDLSALESSIAELQQAAATIDNAGSDIAESLQCLTKRRDLAKCWEFSLRDTMRKARKINRKLAGFEGGFIDEDGLEGRPWYRSLVQAPGRFLGYGATPFPGLTEALTIETSVARARVEAKRLTRAIRRTAHSLEL